MGLVCVKRANANLQPNLCMLLMGRAGHGCRYTVGRTARRLPRNDLASDARFVGRRHGRRTDSHQRAIVGNQDMWRQARGSVRDDLDGWRVDAPLRD